MMSLSTIAAPVISDESFSTVVSLLKLLSDPQKTQLVLNELAFAHQELAKSRQAMLDEQQNLLRAKADFAIVKGDIDSKREEVSGLHDQLAGERSVFELE